jgi:hypothetical protein
VSLIFPVGKKRIVAFVRIGDEEVKDGTAEQHVHNVEEGYTEDVPGFIKNAERNKKLWFERVNLWMLYHILN